MYLNFITEKIYTFNAYIFKIYAFNESILNSGLYINLNVQILPKKYYLRELQGLSNKIFIKGDE